MSATTVANKPGRELSLQYFDGSKKFNHPQCPEVFWEVKGDGRTAIFSQENSEIIVPFTSGQISGVKIKKPSSKNLLWAVAERQKKTIFFDSLNKKFLPPPPTPPEVWLEIDLFYANKSIYHLRGGKWEETEIPEKFFLSGLENFLHYSKEGVFSKNRYRNDEYMTDEILYRVFSPQYLRAKWKDKYKSFVISFVVEAERDVWKTGTWSIQGLEYKRNKSGTFQVYKIHIFVQKRGGEVSIESLD